METKTCTKCKEILPISNFMKSGNGYNRPECLACKKDPTRHVLNKIDDLPDEIWLPIKNASRYFVSNYSRIKYYTIFSLNRSNGDESKLDWKLLVKSKMNDYMGITIYNNEGKKKPMTVYRLVFWTFNPNIEKIRGYEIDHIDQNSFNDKLSNLQYILSRHNCIKRSLSKTKTSKFAGVVRRERPPYRFIAGIRWNGSLNKSKKVYLGEFDTEEEASIAYQKALQAINENYFTKELIKTFKQ